MDSVVGFIVELDDNQNIKQTGHGVRYRVRRLGIDSPSTPANKLPWFDVLLPPTVGSGDGLRARSVNYSVGDMVVVHHMDSSKQRGWIVGHFARTSLTQYSGEVKTEDKTTASGGDQGGETTLPTKVNRGRNPAESNTAESEQEKEAIKAVKEGTGATEPKETAAKEGEYESLFAEGEVPQGASTGNPDTTSGSRPVVTRTADNFINSSFKTRETRIADNPTPEQLSQIQSQGYTFTPNADGTPGGKLENPNIYTE